MDIIGKKGLYFFISAIVIIPGLISLIRYGLRFSIEFTGGSVIELRMIKSDNSLTPDSLRKIIEQSGVEVSTIQRSETGSYLIRSETIDRDKVAQLKSIIEKQTGLALSEEHLETVGPTISRELTRNAAIAVFVACLAIIIYIAWAFRSVPKPASSWSFGICAIMALIHDVFVLVGLFSLLGYFSKVEVDTLFVTALLTVIGFSVHDTIVVFDRIRENLQRGAGKTFAGIVNDSIKQTFVRSLNTSLTVLFMLFALLLFSSGSLRWFVVALLVGIVSGTYSSIFNASPLLVVWYEWRQKRAS